MAGRDNSRFKNKRLPKSTTPAAKGKKNKRAYELSFILLVLAALFLGLSLFSYSPEDPSYSTIVFSRYQESVSNLFGKAGAFTADFLGMLFGWIALLIPFGIIYAIVNIVKVYRNRISGIRAGGGIFFMALFLIVLSMLTGLISESDPFYPDKAGGGLLGVAGAVMVKSFLGRTGGIIVCSMLALLLLFATLRLSIFDMANKIAAKLGGKIAEKKEAAKDAALEAGEKEKPSLGERLSAWFAAYRAEAAQRRMEKAAERRAAKEERDKLRLEEMLRKSTEEAGEPFYMTPGDGDAAGTGPLKVGASFNEAGPDINIGEINTEPQTNAGTTDRNDIFIADLETVKRAQDDEERIPDYPADYPDKSELLTVARLEELLAQREAAVNGEDDNDLDIFEDLIKDAHQMEKTSARVKNIVTGRNYKLPFDLLETPDDNEIQPDKDELRAKADLLLSKLRDFGVDGNIREIRPGPVVTLFELEPAPGIKISKIANLENDLALAMSAISIRIIAPIPGKAAVGIEIPNEHRSTVKLRELLETNDFKQNDSPLAVAFGKSISGRPYFADLRSMPHLLVAGTTGSGKSVCINTIICSILYKSSPDAVKFVMIDPKMVELNVYNGIPHLAAPVVTDARKASAVLNNVVREMEERYKKLSECNVRNIDSYSRYIQSHPEYDPMPYMVVIVDEFGDLMMVAGKEVEAAIIRIAQLARAVGIHLVLATQRPSVNVITGIIKANMPARISFKVSSKIDSRTILDQNGAELLLGKGDSLFIPPGTSHTTRIHGCFVSEDEVKNVVEELKTYGEPVYNMALLEETPAGGAGGFDDELDPRYDEAVQIAREKGEASISMIQRYLRIGYNRAARIVESMEIQGLIAQSDGTSKPRKFLGN